MKKTIFLSLAVVAVLLVSLAINVTQNNNASSNVNLTELMQTANADEYWSFTSCADPFGPTNFSTSDYEWWNNISYDVPFDELSGNILCCLAGGSSQCTVAIYQDDIFDGYNGETSTYISDYGRWVGGNENYLAQTGNFDASGLTIVRTIGNMHQVRNVDYDGQ